ncbi:TMEM165/GDT1 family protein [Vibrio cyclitrophicus]
MSVLAISITTVALAEIGDRANFCLFYWQAVINKPLPIIAAIFLATIANHAVAAWLGVLVSDLLSPAILKWVVVASFAAMALWVLIPDKLDEDESISNKGPFVANLLFRG